MCGTSFKGREMPSQARSVIVERGVHGGMFATAKEGEADTPHRRDQEVDREKGEERDRYGRGASRSLRMDVWLLKR